MNTSHMLLASLLGFALSPAIASASTVTLYGILDPSLTYVSNVGGKGQARMDSGMMRASRIGLTGGEDLGGGYAAIFKLENGFTIGTGATLIDSSLMFQREAWVGIKARYGTLTAGRQFDFMFTDLGRYSNAYFMGAAQFHPSAPKQLLGTNGVSQVLDGTAGTAVNNSVKFESALVTGLTVGAMYGFGGVAGDFAAGRRYSGHLRYEYGAAAMSIVYTERRTPNGDGAIRNYGVGGSFEVGRATFSALYTGTQYSIGGDKVQIVDVGARYLVTPAFQLGLGYTYIDPNKGKDNAFIAGIRNQIGVIADYFLSKQTDIYGSFTYQRAAEGSSAKLFGSQASSSNAQSQVNIGFKHSF